MAEGAIDTVVPEGTTIAKAGEAGLAASLLTEQVDAVAAPVTDPAATEVKAEEGTEKPKDGKADEKVVGAPEVYTDFTFPDGVVVDKEAVGEFTPLAKELNLTQDAAQKLIDLQTKYAVKQAEQQAQAWEATRNGWRETFTADKEIGGQNVEVSIANAKKALEKYGTPELSQALTDTGTGDHPEFIRFISRVGKAMSEGVIHVGSQPSGVPQKSVAERLFPSMTNK